MDSLYQTLAREKTLLGVILLLVLLLAENLSPFVKGGTGRERARHGARNLTLGFVNALMSTLIFVALWTGAANYSEIQHLGLLYHLPLATIPRAATAVLLLDLWTYFWHRWNHTFPFLWRFHRTHHSDPRMDVTTAARFHLGEIFFSGALRTPLICLLGAQMHELALYELLMYSVTQLHHANLALPPGADRLLRCLVVSPNMHKIHHSRRRIETDSNYSSLFSIWDRVFASYRMRGDLDAIQFGLDGFDDRKFQVLPGLMTTPILEKSTRLRRWLALGWFIPLLILAWLASRFARFWLG